LIPVSGFHVKLPHRLEGRRERVRGSSEMTTIYYEKEEETDDVPHCLPLPLFTTAEKTESQPRRCAPSLK
jgi:hypothetical protein